MAISSQRHTSFAPGGKQYYTVWADKVSFSSPRVNKKLKLEPQAFSLTKNYATCTQEYWQPPQGSSGFTPSGANVTNLPTFPVSLEQRARSRFYSRMKQGSAALGMTFATMGQTRDMIKSKSDAMTQHTIEISRDIESARRRGKLVKRNTGLANAWLEYFYGWNPFFQDIHDGLQVVSSLTPEASWVTGRGFTPVKSSDDRTSGGTRTITTFTGNQYCAYNARVQVTNPNLWMLNRLGLINPGTIFWDLVPWSFVVNMFVNANSLINSVSDEVGVNVDKANTTRTTKVTRVVFHRSTSGSASMTSVCDMTSKNRVLGNLPVAVVWKKPTLNWELAVTASALLLQRVNKVNSIADKLYRGWAYRHTYTE